MSNGQSDGAFEAILSGYDQLETMATKRNPTHVANGEEYSRAQSGKEISKSALAQRAGREQEQILKQSTAVSGKENTLGNQEAVGFGGVLMNDNGAWILGVHPRTRRDSSRNGDEFAASSESDQRKSSFSSPS